MAYSHDFIKHVLMIKEEENLSHRATSKRFRIGNTTLRNWLQGLWPVGKRDKPPQKIHNDKLLEDVKKYPDSYNYERAKRFGVSANGIGDALKRLKITRKKRRSRTLSETSKSEIYL